jgi:hypothetical protein
MENQKRARVGKWGMSRDWAPLKTLDFDGLVVILTTQLPDNIWEYLRNTKNRKLRLGRKTKEGF